MEEDNDGTSLGAGDDEDRGGRGYEHDASDEGECHDFGDDEGTIALLHKRSVPIEGRGMSAVVVGRRRDGFLVCYTGSFFRGSEQPSSPRLQS